MVATRPLAVVTGASSGIGFELARQFADHGYDLVVAAEDDELEQATKELSVSAQVIPVKVDLAEYTGVEKLADAVEATGRAVDALALNAGMGLGGGFVQDQRLDDVMRLIRLNVESTVHLAKRLMPAMVERGEGRVLFTSSIASEMPGSFQAAYNASKSFVQSFAEAVGNELQDTGVTVTALMPGPTDTEFFDRAGLEDTKMGASDKKDDPAEVAKQGFEAMMEGKTKVIAGGLMTKAQGAMSKVLPDKLKAAAHRKMAEPGSAG